MQMSFHFSLNETILFDGWTATDWQGISGSFVGIVLLSVLYEALKNYREHLFVSSAVGTQNELLRFKEESMLSGIHLWQTFLHLIQIVVGYSLMLIFMTYNVWLCAAVVIGGAFGYWIFAWRKTKSDNSDCCN